MSFKLNWNCIEKDSFSTYAKELLDEALNGSKRPNILSDDIKIIDLNFGTVAPIFQILEIGDLAIDKFRGIFNFKYYGDASITVTTKVSASLLKNYNNNIDDELSKFNNDNDNDNEFIKPNFIVSDCDFNIPLNLTLSNFKMSSIIIIVFSKTKGLTLVFKNDPLENIDVNSTFDKIKPIANFLQKKIEIQISDLFKEFLPNILYKFSLKYTLQSFDQFHKNLLIEEQEEDDLKKKKILLKDIDPDMPLHISPGSLMRLTRLSSSRQTLSLGNKIDNLSCDKLNKDIITKSFVNIMLKNSNNFNFNKIELNKVDFLSNNTRDINNKIQFIKNFQSKSFMKNFNNAKPKRRVIKMNLGINKEKKENNNDGSNKKKNNIDITTSNKIDNEKGDRNIKETKIKSSRRISTVKHRKPSIDLTKIDRDEEKQINKRILKLNRLIKKSTDGNEGGSDKASINSTIALPPPPPPPPYSV